MFAFCHEFTISPSPSRVCPMSPICSDADEHQSGAVGQIGEVQQEVETGEDGHGDQFCLVSPPAVLLVKLKNGPEDGGRQVHDDGQEPVGRQELGEGYGEAASALSHAQHHHGHGEDEADAVHCHAPLQGRVVVIGHGVADQDEDNAGHEGLANLHQTWSRFHVTRHFSWPGLGQAHLHHVGNCCQAGEDRGRDAMIANFLGEILTLEKKHRENDRGREAEEGGVAGDCDGEVGPGDRDSGLEAALLHQQDQQGTGEAESPAEDAPVRHTSVGQPASICYDAESGAGEQHRSDAHP